MKNMLAIILVIIGLSTRLVPHLSQFTAILAVAFFAGLYLRGWQAVAVPLSLMIISDLIIGFHDTMFYTYGAMILISGLGLWLKSHKSFATVLGGSVASAVIFFVVTNLGAWPTLYPMTVDGLRECFVMAIPFFRSTLVSTVAYSLVLYAGYEWMLKRSQGTALARLF